MKCSSQLRQAREAAERVYRQLVGQLVVEAERRLLAHEEQLPIARQLHQVCEAAERVYRQLVGQLVVEAERRLLHKE